MNYREAEDAAKEEFELLSLDSYKEIGDIKDVNAYYYTVTTYLNSDENEKAIIEILKDLAHKENICIIFVSHSDRVKKEVDILYYLENGKLKDAN